MICLKPDTINPEPYTAQACHNQFGRVLAVNQATIKGEAAIAASP
ncbi:hypothetical protein [Leptolyngbya subtilissima]